MDYRALLGRILDTVDREAYFTAAAHVDPRQRGAIQELEAYIQSADFHPEVARERIRRYAAEGRIDRPMMLSALHVVACHPRVADWEEAARLAGEQEYAALELGGPNLQANLASVDRHRGVLAYLRGHYEAALDHFTRALERERSWVNLQNVLCTLLKLGDEHDARSLLLQIRRSFPADLVAEVDQAVRTDPDLALLRNVEGS